MGVGVRFILGNMNTVAVNSNTVDVELRLLILRNSLHEIQPAQKFTQTTCKDKLTKHLTIILKKKLLDTKDLPFLKFAGHHKKHNGTW